ncbi:TIGR03085 family protein [Blastococcus sp. TML/M2B]|uniref:TIGR03085 family metal-binding protein n=1 Tax=unclassified Blastococcus TaxID=2619396 RepID=UPI00190DDFE3|nr:MULTISPECIES: TIGR03085 family metal-binding protein [unclassified Blastococcus]MBN1092456.1 TIGR03085 family protein [Blastococcus sp. TML/M2B]MBN1097450.1 TIGR03085 family protein [Blastococcus sp. TML/C7B]
MTSAPDASAPLADQERRALADLLDELGPDAPTCCAGWTTAHLAAHLAVRDRRPDAMPGYALEQVPGLGRLGAWSHRVEDSARLQRSYAELVTAVRSGPPAWSPLAWPGLERLNAPEFAIHHEDVRRAQPGWTPRELPAGVQDQLWVPARLYARRAAGRRGAVLRRTDRPGTEARIGAGGRTVEGEPLELLLWASGRTGVARVRIC